MKHNMSEPYEKTVLNKLHEVQMEILNDFAYVCQKNKLSFFGIYGTAIGAVRHKGFVPWDDDIDVGMLREDYELFLKIIDKEMGDKYQLMTPLRNKEYACTVTHLQRRGTRFVPVHMKDLKCKLGINIDIFPFDVVAPTRKGQFLQNLGTLFWGKLLFLKGTSEPLIPFEGLAGKVMSVVCKGIHELLTIFRIKTSWLYKNYEKCARKYNESGGKYISSFEYGGCIKDKVLKSGIFPIKEVEFENGKIPLPNNNDEFLKKVYGDYMKIPQKEKQINHCPYVLQFEGEKAIIQGENS